MQIAVVGLLSKLWASLGRASGKNSAVGSIDGLRLPKTEGPDGRYRKGDAVEGVDQPTGHANKGAILDADYRPKELSLIE